MTIRDKTLQENSAKYTISITGNQTLTEAFKLFEDNKYPENDTYLVVSLPNSQYNVTLFSELKKTLQMMGKQTLTQPLSDLPITPASRIIPKDTTESGGEILDWVRTNPQSKVVVTDAGNFIGLFVNSNRSRGSGLADNLPLLELCGELIKLSEDPRADYVPKVEPPTCPLCNKQNFYQFNVEKKAYICPSCDGIVEQL